jgi:hypothetical protein
MRLVCLLLFFTFTGSALAAPADEAWFRVLLDGRKIGSMHLTRSAETDRVITTQTLEVVLERLGTQLHLATRETDLETRTGQPLGFALETILSGSRSRTRGSVEPDGTVRIDSEVGGNRQTRHIVWPRGALLAEGLRLTELRSGLLPGSRFREYAFQVESQEAVPIDCTIGARERVDLPEGVEHLQRIEQRLEMQGTSTRNVVWVDTDHNVRKMTMPLMGFELTLLACSQACATAPNQPADILSHALVAAPAPLDRTELHRGLILHVRARDGGAPLHFAQTDEQQVRTTEDGVVLRIVPLGQDSSTTREPGPEPSDAQPNAWLQSDAPMIRELAVRGAAGARTPREQMQSLEHFVRGYIRRKDLSVGYASALEVAENPQGDCTEHAVLLAALGRALGIPTRVVDGLVYTGSYAGIEHVFVPHAWVQAFVDGHWQSFDAALTGFDAGHVALAVGDGDPWPFFAGLDILGRIQIDRVAPLEASPVHDASATH